MIQRNYNHVPPDLLGGPGLHTGRPRKAPWWVLTALRTVLFAAAAWLGYLTYLYPVSPAPLFGLLTLIALFGTVAKD